MKGSPPAPLWTIAELVQGFEDGLYTRDELFDSALWALEQLEFDAFYAALPEDVRDAFLDWALAVPAGKLAAEKVAALTAWARAMKPTARA